MGGGCYTEFDTLGPKRIVVVLAIHREIVDPVSMEARVVLDAWCRFGGAMEQAGHHGHLEVQLLHRVFEFINRLNGRAGRDACSRCHAVGMRTEYVCDHCILSATARPTQFLVGFVDEKKAERGIDDGVVKTEFIQAVTQ